MHNLSPCSSVICRLLPNLDADICRPQVSFEDILLELRSPSSPCALLAIHNVLHAADMTGPSLSTLR